MHYCYYYLFGLEYIEVASIKGLFFYELQLNLMIAVFCAYYFIGLELSTTFWTLPPFPADYYPLKVLPAPPNLLFYGDS